MATPQPALGLGGSGSFNQVPGWMLDLIARQASPNACITRGPFIITPCLIRRWTGGWIGVRVVCRLSTSLVSCAAIDILTAVVFCLRPIAGGINGSPSSPSFSAHWSVSDTIASLMRCSKLAQSCSRGRPCLSCLGLFPTKWFRTSRQSGRPRSHRRSQVICQMMASYTVQ